MRVRAGDLETRDTMRDVLSRAPCDEATEGMNWWAQFAWWQEIIFGVVMLCVGLFLEDRIDIWRERRRR